MHQTGHIIVLDQDPQILPLVKSATGRASLAFPSILAFQKKWDDIHPVAFFVDVPSGKIGEMFQFIPQFKARWPFCPIIVIVTDPVGDGALLSEALASGADDAMYKPLKSKELLARLQARLDALAKRQFKEVIPLGDLIVDKTHRTLSGRSGIRHLSPTEMNLLLCLLHAKGTVIQRDTLKKRCWGQVYVSDNALNRKLHEVRRIVRELSAQVEITTLYGIGFVLELVGRGVVEDTGVEPVTSTLPALRSTR